jgi:pimeloyl-ACP methyl ester carboxylesterase
MSSDRFVSRFYDSSDGLKLHYRDYAGPIGAPFTIVCIPGLTRNARDFDALAPYLARSYRVLCVELRGRGLSAYAPDPATYVPPVYVRDVMALLKAARLKQVVFIGTSLGGLVSTLFTAVMPAKVLGVVLNDIGPEIGQAGLVRIASYLGKSADIKTWQDAAAAMRAIDAPIYPDYGDEDWLRMAKRRFIEDANGQLRPDYDFNISKPFAAAAPVNLWPFFERLCRIPALLLRGATSDILTAETVEKMKVAVPTLEVVEVPNRGHAPYLDEPAALQAIEAFLTRVPRRIGLLARLHRTAGAGRFLMRMKRAKVL